MKTKPLTAVQIDALAQRLFETPVVASIHVGLSISVKLVKICLAKPILVCSAALFSMSSSFHFVSSTKQMRSDCLTRKSALGRVASVKLV